MKLKLLVLVSTIFMATAASAEINSGDQCDANTYQKAVIGADVLTCLNGKYVATGHVGTTPVQITVLLIENKEGVSRIINQFTLSTLDGEPVPVSLTERRSFLMQRVGAALGTEPEPQEVSEGIGAMFTPVLKDDGAVELEVAFGKTEIESVQYRRQGDQDIAFPTTRHFATANSIRVPVDVESALKINGSERYLNPLTKAYLTWNYDYTMKIKVSKL